MCDLNEIQAMIEQRTGKSFVDVVRTRYWASFATVEALARELGCSRKGLKALLERHSWELQKPPALRLQNAALPDGPLLRSNGAETITVERFTAGDDGRPASAATRVEIRADESGLRFTFDCFEPHMESLAQGAGTRKEENDPFNVGIWECHLGFYQGSYRWLPSLMREIGRDRILEQARAVPPRPYSVFEDDCVIVCLTPVNIGDDKSYLDVARFEPDPFELARRLPAHPESRIYLTGSFYYVAVNPAGVVLDGYFDPWEDGFFWPSWESESVVECRRESARWRVELAIPLCNLEPLMDPGAVWGIDLYRHRPARDGGAEYARSKRTVFFRYEGKSIAAELWRPTFEDIEGRINRHAWCPAQLPQVLEMTERPLPEAVTTRLDEEIPEGDWPRPEDWARAGVVSGFYEDRTGAPAQFRTEVRLLHDGRRLFVEFRCDEAHTDELQSVSAEEEAAEYPESPAANFLDRREHFGMGWGDYVEIILAPDVDGADRYHGGLYDILVNARGRVLERCYDPFGMWSVQGDEQWCSGARVEVRVERERWIVRLAVPFECIHGIRTAGEWWHMNLLRKRAAKSGDPLRELSAWSPTYGRIRNAGRYGTLRLPGADFGRLERGTNRPKFYLGRLREEPIAWRPRRRDSDCLMGLSFADGEGGWAVGGLGSIFKTDDGGRTWREQESGTGYILEKVSFADRRHGWAVGGWPRQPGAALTGGMGIILATSDGGETWRQQWEGKGAWLYDVCFVNPETGWAVGEYGTVLGTQDGGRTWRHLPRTGTLNDLYSVCFVDERNGWAAGGHETILATRDGGRTWRRLRVPPLRRPFGAWEGFRAVHFVDLRHGWVVGPHGTMLRTDDGGERWEQGDLGLPDNVAEIFDLNDVWFSDEQHGWTAGEPGSVIMRTDDGGRSWQGIPTGFGGALHGIRFTDRDRGWAVGEGGMRLATSDGGGTWTPLACGPGRPRWMYVAAHLHHMNNVAGLIASMADDHDFACVFPSNSCSPWQMFADIPRQSAFSASWSLGARAVRVWRDFRGGRRRAPGRLHHHYQTKRGLEPLVRRFTAAIRALRPEVVIGEWPIVDEGYWAGEPAFGARALTLAFSRAGDPGEFPELAEIGLRPWQPGKLYYLSTWANDLYGVHPTTHTFSPRDGYSETLGMDYSEAVFQCRCCWYGLLDRARFKMPPPGKRRGHLAAVPAHLKFDESRSADSTSHHPRGRKG